MSMVSLPLFTPFHFYLWTLLSPLSLTNCLTIQPIAYFSASSLLEFITPLLASRNNLTAGLSGMHHPHVNPVRPQDSRHKDNQHQLCPWSSYCAVPDLMDVFLHGHPTRSDQRLQHGLVRDLHLHLHCALCRVQDHHLSFSYGKGLCCHRRRTHPIQLLGKLSFALCLFDRS